MSMFQRLSRCFRHVEELFLCLSGQIWGLSDFSGTVSKILSISQKMPLLNEIHKKKTLSALVRLN